jgi:hypothetical protein
MNIFRSILRSLGINMTFTNSLPHSVEVVVDGNEVTVQPGQTVTGSNVNLIAVNRGGGSGEE